MYIKVIVDIPAAQVNRPFDYAVPQEWQEYIELGSRVEVPFGNRQLLGFVVEISQESSYAGKIKPISKVLDYQSFLNEELVELSQVMADRLQAFRITILQTMLPAMLRVKYENWVKISAPAALLAEIELQATDHETVKTGLDRLADKLEQTLAEESTEDLRLSKSWFDDLVPSRLIRQWLDQQWIELEYQVLDQTTVKRETWVYRQASTQELERALADLDGRSYRQRELVEYLLNTSWERILLADLMAATNLRRPVIQTVADKGWLRLVDELAYRDPLADLDIPETTARPLFSQQQAAYDQIRAAIDQSQAETFLLEGVTGSGKTEVYLQLMARARDQGQGSILLVPEIALTPQMVNQVRGRFPEGVAVLHSGLSISEKYDEWRRIIRGEATIVVGARSSIFAPVASLGLIIIDEEHETTYKQGDNPRYHARDVARWRSRYHQAPLVLGSATPSLESRARAEVGNYRFLRLTERVNQAPLPPVQLIDMTQTAIRQTQNEFSPQLLASIKDRLDWQEQVILMLNRRGYASYLLCRECGYVLECPHCDISLTYHKSDQRMKCHYCDYQQAVPSVCPQCQSPHIRTMGLGTQKVAETLQDLLPEARIIRMDNDTTRRKGAHRRLLGQFERGEADVLIGTQMIAKGLDFERATLVGVINADTALNLPDFRAAEKTFQLLTQVSGRAGRGQLQGQVIIQTYNPDHYVMQLAQHHDYERFFYAEMQRRHLANYPPYYYTSLVSISSKQEGRARQVAYELKNLLSDPTLEAQGSLIILGPSRASISKIKDHYYFQLFLKYKDQALIQSHLEALAQRTQELARQGIYVNLDHEPQYFI